MNYQYKPIKADTVGAILEKVNEMGAQGWRLVSIMEKDQTPWPSFYVAFMEKELIDDSENL